MSLPQKWVNLGSNPPTSNELLCVFLLASPLPSILLWFYPLLFPTFLITLNCFISTEESTQHYGKRTGLETKGLCTSSASPLTLGLRERYYISDLFIKITNIYSVIIMSQHMCQVPYINYPLEMRLIPFLFPFLHKEMGSENVQFRYPGSIGVKD